MAPRKPLLPADAPLFNGKVTKRNRKYQREQPDTTTAKRHQAIKPQSCRYRIKFHTVICEKLRKKRYLCTEVGGYAYVTRTLNDADMKKFAIIISTAIAQWCALWGATPDFDLMTTELGEESLPLVNIIIDDIDRVNKAEYTAARVEIADYQERTEPGKRIVSYNCKIRYRGNFSLQFEKKSFNVKLYTDDYSDDLDADILGLREENSWILDAMAIDCARMRNRVCFDIWNELSRTPYDTKFDRRNGTIGTMVELFINGSYHGLYCLTDKIDRKLLNLKKAKADDDEITYKGLMYKGDAWSATTRLMEYDDEAGTGTDTWLGWELQYPDDYPSTGAWQPLKELIDFINDTDDSDFFAKWQEWFYVDNLVDFKLFGDALYYHDMGYKNSFLSTPDITAGHRYLLTVWDCDASFGRHWDGQNYPYLFTRDGRWKYIQPYKRLLADSENRLASLLGERWQEVRTNIFAPESIAARFQAYADKLTASGAWERERALWNNNPVPLPDDIDTELALISEWYAKNYSEMDRIYSASQSGICSPDATTGGNNSPAIYTIDGRCFPAGTDISSLPHGFYIINGKKMIH